MSTRAWRELGFPLVSVSQTPQQALDEFARLDKEGNIDRILERMVPEAPAVRQAEAKRLQAVRDLAEAELDLRYCDITSEIDGVVSSRSVNPGNHVSAGQSLMAVRSLTEIWVDANFKETQLADLRIGQRVRARSTCTAADANSRVASPASPWGRARPCRCCRRRTPRATS